MKRRIIPMMRMCGFKSTPDTITIDKNRGGMFCGYIAIPNEYVHIIHENPDEYSLYGLSPDIEYSCHGGVTYYAVANDLRNEPNFIPLIDMTDIDTKNYKIIGFDFNHLEDTFEKCTPMEIQKETIRYYNFIKEYISNRL